MRKRRSKQRAKVEMSRSEDSESAGTSSSRLAEEMEGEDQDIESSLNEEMAASQQEQSAPSDEMDESSEESIQGLEEMQVKRDSSLKPSQNQENVMVQEEETEEEEEKKEKEKRRKKKKKEEEGEEEEEEEHEVEEKQEEEEEEEEKEEHESLSMDEVGQQWIHSCVWRKCARLSLHIPSTSWSPQWCGLCGDLHMCAHLLLPPTGIRFLSDNNAFKNLPSSPNILPCNLL